MKILEIIIINAHKIYYTINVYNCYNFSGIMKSEISFNYIKYFKYYV